jgi:hypothetical protein
MAGLTVFPLLALLLSCPPEDTDRPRLNELEYFETRAFNVLVFSNWYNDLFSDSKMSGIEIIHHGVRTATNGDVRLNPTPEQWDPIPHSWSGGLTENQTVEAFSIPSVRFAYSIRPRTWE